MYLKSKDLTLVLIFDTLEHFRCFSGHRRNGALGDARCDDPAMHAWLHLSGTDRRRACGLLHAAQSRRVPCRSERCPLLDQHVCRHGRSDRRHRRGYGGRWYDCVRTTYHQKTIGQAISKT